MPTSLATSQIYAAAGPITVCGTPFIAQRKSPQNVREEEPVDAVSKVDRREFLVRSLSMGGGFALALLLPSDRFQAATAVQISGKPWEAADGTEISPWLLIAP